MASAVGGFLAFRAMDLQLRIKTALYMREAWSDFGEFATAGMRYLGFPITPMQLDIAQYMASGERFRMVMAQRGQAKSTLAALLAVWKLIQNPATRVLIVSAGGDKASEVAAVVYRLISQWDILEYLRPDRNNKDRDAAERFDVHFALKGIDQSPSVTSIGITANLQGRRADLLIADDVESTKNALTALQRDQLLRLTKEFSAIVTHGEILYLGTPQTKDSIYNTLPARGYEVKVWTGRYPNQEELPKYGNTLADSIMQALLTDPSLQTGGGLTGKRGKPTDPKRFDEHDLIEKELDWAAEGFQLQYMLDTSLADAMRQQLKLSDLIVADYDFNNVPEQMVWRASPDTLIELPPSFPVVNAKMYRGVIPQAVRWIPLPKTLRWCYIDPAGGGKDELAWAIGCSVGAYIHVLHVGGVTGGLTAANTEHMMEVFKKFGVTDIRVESNMGHGLFEINLRKAFEDADFEIPVSGEYSTGQKEKRIIDSLVSTMQRHYIVVHQSVFEADDFYNSKHGQLATDRSVFHQLDNITTDRNSLKHDDRLEAVAGLVRLLKHELALDEAAVTERRELAEIQKFISNPMGYETVKQESAGTRSRLKLRNRNARPFK